MLSALSIPGQPTRLPDAWRRRRRENGKDKAMQYLLLIYESETSWAAIPEDEKGRIFQEYMDYTNGIRKSGNYLAGEALQPVSTATTVRVKSGKTLTTDGPFAETREQLGGFYMVEASNLDEAIKLASGIPAARTGSIEVRPIMPTPRPE
jgi:hypothetical protein